MTHEPNAPLIGAALTALRKARGIKAYELACRLGLSKSLLSLYETGESVPSPPQLERLLAALDASAEDLAELVEALRRPAAPSGAPVPGLDPTPAERRYVRQLGAAVRREVEGELERTARAGHVRRARQAAEADVRIVLDCPPADRRVLVERWPAYHRWAAVERLSWESEREAANDPDAALRLAELARGAAERMPAGPGRVRACGYAWAYVGNALRVKNDHEGSRRAFVRGWELWREGAAAELPLEEWRLEEWRLLDLEASLLIDTRRLDSALENLRRALDGAPGEAMGSLLLSRGRAWGQKGEPEKALADLDEAASRISKEWTPRHVLVLQFNRVVNLRRLHRYEAACQLLPEVRSRVNDLGTELDLVRTLWLEGTVMAGLGRMEEGLVALEQVEVELRRREMAFDGALVNLDIAEIELAQGRTAEVQRRAMAMWWIFRSQGVHREALAALRMFCEAANVETATVELARRVKEFLEMARHEPDLRFESEGPPGRFSREPG
jgi:transcriptional regulator with XRE-family HTH domain